jgi:hypothetical protein
MQHDMPVARKIPSDYTRLLQIVVWVVPRRSGRRAEQTPNMHTQTDAERLARHLFVRKAVGQTRGTTRTPTVHSKLSLEKVVQRAGYRTFHVEPRARLLIVP